ncbi:MAG: flagellar biosynthesis protein FlhB [Pseudorhodobacter sp.]
MSEEDSSEKEHAPSPKKLEDARRKGEIPRSADLTTAAGYAGFLLAGLTFGPVALRELGTITATLLDQANDLAPLMMDNAEKPAGNLIGAIVFALMPFFVLPAIAAATMLLVQRAWVFAPAKLAPKFNRISPIATAKNKFGRQGLFEFFKSFCKLVLTATLLAGFLLGRAEDILTTLHLPSGVIAARMTALLLDFLILIVCLLGTIGAMDFLWQRAEHLRRHRMSRKELMDEMKSAEGDPHMKSRRRQRGQEIATNQMLFEVPQADVIIVNPTHYAIALKWERGSRRAPVCLAKGVDEIAARIRERATEAEIPIHHDPPTARTLHASVEIGQEIHPDHYRAVAAAIRFSEAMRKKARRRLY